MSSYQEFLKTKHVAVKPSGFYPKQVNDKLFPFQKEIVKWAIRKGRCGLFKDTGLGKTAAQLSWADEIIDNTGGKILIICPLAVAKQTLRESEKFDIRSPVRIVESQEQCSDGINLTNYEKLHRFNADKFSGVVLDESSILKSLDGSTKKHLIEAFSATPYKLCCTATPAPNDHMELGNHAEFLGVMTRAEMLSMFFVHDGGDTSKWRLRGHAEKEFWKWMASWCVMIRKPSDIGFSDDGYDLPPLTINEHVIETKVPDHLLFNDIAGTLGEQRAARRETIEERAVVAKRIIMKNESDLIGSFDTMVLCGNQNTQPTGNASTTKTPVSENAENSKEELLKKTRLTCGDTTKETKPSGRKRGGKMPTKSMSQEGQNTPATQCLGSNALTQQNEGPNRQGLQPDSNLSSESPLSNTSLCSNPKMESAPSANSIQPDTGCTSTIAAKADQSGDCSAKNAISESGNSTTNQSCLSPLRSIYKNQWLIWCNLNAEQDEMERLLGSAAVSIRGQTKDADRLRLHEQWLSGEKQILITKSELFGFGLNWQHCSNMIFLGISHSYEQFYQSVRRCYRFGQTKPVNVYVIVSDREASVLDNIKRKQADADRMASGMISAMSEWTKIELGVKSSLTKTYNPKKRMQIPSWLA